jgi:hypothetical protein
MSDSSETPEGAQASAQIDHGSYEIVRERLLGHARSLSEQASDLNARRLELFGGTELAMIGSERIRSENNCVPRDIVAVGDELLFGYNVFIGLRNETRVADVLSLHGFETREEGFAFPEIASDAATFLQDPQFVRDFAELYAYYKNAELTQLRVVDSKLLAVFQVSESLTDVKAFRWSISDAGLSYIDNRGERDHHFPASHDFEWTQTTRDDHVAGRHAHVNVADEIFVETTNGTLTIKVEDNTEDGGGIYREPVEDFDQALEDAEIHFARVGVLILLKIRPYREEQWRYLVFNTRTQKVDRIDAIGHACVSLPDDHGIIFPGGYYLESGDTKTFDGDVSGMEFSRVLRSPNGEDVLYVFYERRAGGRILLPYNTIRKEVQNPIHCHGYSLYEDGRMVVFRESSNEPTRVHTMQIWQTPFTSDEVAAAAPSTGSPLETIGNPDLVRGISDAFSLTRAIEHQEPSRPVYEDLIATATRMIDHYHWLDHEDVGNLSATLKEILATAELVIDEFEKVESLRAQAQSELNAMEASIAELFESLRPDTWTAVDAYVAALSQLRRKRGELIGLRDLRYVDGARIDELEARVTVRFTELSDAAVGYLLQDAALAPYAERIDVLIEQAAGVETVVEANPLVEAIEQVGVELDLLTEVVGTLQIEDATHRTRILEEISEVFSQLNRGKAIIGNRRKELLGREGRAEFAAEFKLFGQSVTSALSLADSPEKCDDQLSRLLIGIEDLESRFSEFDEYLAELATKREDVYEAFSARKQSLLDEIQRRASHTFQAATRILDGIGRRAGAFGDADELNAYFAADPMILKARDLSERLRELGDSVRADELESRLKSTREEALRGLRDRRDIYEDGDAVIVLGKHRFSVNRQPLDLTLVPRDGRMAFQLTGTDYHEPVIDETFERTRAYWDQLFVSETADLYRGEYLAACVLAAAERGEEDLSINGLRQDARTDGALVERVRGFAASRYDEGYERGLHDEDAARILGSLLTLYATAGLLRYSADARALAVLYWANLEEGAERELIEHRAGSLGRLREAFGPTGAIGGFVAQLHASMEAFAQEAGITHDPHHLPIAAEYLFEELAAESRGFVAGAEARRLAEAFRSDLETRGTQRSFVGDLSALEGHTAARYELVVAWLEGFVDEADAEHAALRPALREAAAGLITSDRLERSHNDASVATAVEGLLGQHRRIQDGVMPLRLDEFLARLGDYRLRGAVGFRDFQNARGELLERGREELRLQEFQPKVMSAFVRNRLIDEVYLPVIGDNLAKQLGALGDAKRTDQMGLLLLISPPGYGKTTLMEYVADRLGMAFVKVNGPALGHDVTSLDPAAAGNAAAVQEVEKINLAFEMANNVLLYVDDIQHTHPELLQKFISLCDGQRRVEGVWKGRTQTYDLRGKKFAICMAGNPYTESGEKFQIPDMLANRADIYNLGDILSGRDELFALSYIENTLTSNPILSPLAGRDLADVGRLVRMARGENVGADELEHSYSSVELEEVLSVLRKLLRVQQVLLAVNAEYIRSASMDDAFRTEPSFKLQGSYRNMNKLAEKVVAVMNDDELEALIDDHYQGESQTLTTGAEHNLLKLAELRGVLSSEKQRRWDEIKSAYQRVQSLGGAEDDPATRVTGQLSLVTERLAQIRQTLAEVSSEGRDEFTNIDAVFSPFLEKLQENLQALAAPAVGTPAGAGLAPPVAEHMAEISQRLGEIGDSIAIASGAQSPPPDAAILERLDASLQAMAQAAAPSGDAELGSYLERLDATLQAVVQAPRGGEVVQALGPGVKNLLDKMVASIDSTLIPAVRGIEKRSRAEDDPKLKSQLNRTLKNFDMLKDLMETLTKIDTHELLRRSRKIETRRTSGSDQEDSP